MSSLDEAAMMGSDQDNDPPIPEDPTDIFIRSTLEEELPTEEAERRSFPQPQDREHQAGRHFPVLTSASSRAEEDDQTIGVHLQDEVSQTIGGHLTADHAGSPPLTSTHTIHEVDTLQTPNTPYRGLHPVSVAVNIIPRAWQTVRGLWPIFLVVVLSGESIGMRFIDLLVVLMFALVSVWNTFIHWATLRYRIHNGRLEITQGLLNRSARTIDPSRIQNIELVQNLFHTWSGLVELRIETAGEQTTEGLLSALSVEEATDLRAQLAAIGSLAIQSDDTEQSSETVTKLSVPEILAFGLTQRTLGTVAVMAAIGLEVMSQGRPEVSVSLAHQAQPVIIAAAFMLAFVVSWTLSAINALFRYYGHRMVHLGDALRTEHGLTTKRKVEIPLSKVQVVRADEPLLRRVMGYGTVQIETAGLGFIEGQQHTAEGILPMVERAELGRITTTAAPHANVDPWAAELKPAHPNALYRALAGATIRAGVLIGLATTLFGFLSGLVLIIIPVAWIGAWLDWAKQGWLVTDSAVVSRRGFFNRRTYIVSRDKLQSVHLVQGPFMRLQGLNRIVVSVAGSRIALPDTGDDDTAWLQHELSYDMA